MQLERQAKSSRPKIAELKLGRSVFNNVKLYCDYAFFNMKIVPTITELKKCLILRRARTIVFYCLQQQLRPTNSNKIVYHRLNEKKVFTFEQIYNQ